MLQQFDNREHVATDLLNGHEFVGLTLEYNGMSWIWKARSAAGYQGAITLTPHAGHVSDHRRDDTVKSISNSLDAFISGEQSSAEEDEAEDESELATAE